MKYYQLSFTLDKKIRGRYEMPHTISIESKNFLKYISDKDLVSVYNGATATFFPTRYEGFGFPILESFACNTPVVTCRNTSLPEVGGNIALYTDEDGVDEMSYYMELFENENFDLHLFREQAKNYIKRFSWENTALQYVELYKSLL